MSHLEPNWPALLVFCLVCCACCLAFLTLVGMFPLRARPPSMRGASGVPLVVGNVVLLAGLAVGAVLLGRTQLQWTTTVVAGGLVFLFTPALFEIWPRERRDTPAGLAALATVQTAMILGLAIGGLVMPPMDA